MWIPDLGGFGVTPGDRPPFCDQSNRGGKERKRQNHASNSDSADEILGEVGLMLVIVLAVVLAINAAFVAFHIA